MCVEIVYDDLDFLIYVFLYVAPTHAFVLSDGKSVVQFAEDGGKNEIIAALRAACDPFRPLFSKFETLLQCACSYGNLLCELNIQHRPSLQNTNSRR